MRTRYILALAAAALCAACTIESPESETISAPAKKIILTASTESGTPGSKTSVINGGAAVYWEPGDAISVFTGFTATGGDKFVSTNTSQATTADFVGTLTDTAGVPAMYYWCVYPYSEYNTYDATTEEFSFILPDIQKAVEGSFASGLFPAMGHAAVGEPFTMYAVCGGIKFTVQEAGIRCIQFGESGINPNLMNGKITARFGNDGKPEIVKVEPFSAFTTVMAPDGGTFIPGKEYYVVLPVSPDASTASLRLNYFKSDGSFATYSNNSYPGIQRAVFGFVKGIDSKAGAYTTMEPVDLGLSVKWAPFNLGAVEVGGTGLPFAWGETEPSWYSDWEDYKYCMGDSHSFTKYCQDPDRGYNGYTDDLTTLEPEDDAAAAWLGGHWRMPTRDEYTELASAVNCEKEWTENYNGTGVPGLIFTSKIQGYTDKSILLHLTGYRSQYKYYLQKYSEYKFTLQTYGHYWLSTFGGGTDSFQAHYMNVTYGEDHPNNFLGVRQYARYIRPVWDDDSYDIRGVSLRKKLALTIGSSKQLVPTISGGAWADRSVKWESSDPSVATVDPDGTVTMVSEGTATITVTTVAGGLSDTCEVRSVKEMTEMGKTFTNEWMGFYVEWATFNLGATKPEEYGDFYAWGDKETKNEYSWSNYPYSMGNGYTMTKYCTNPEYGFHDATDGLKSLEQSDDIVYELLGGAWRTPTQEDWEELLLNPRTTWEWTEKNGVYGIQVQSGSTGHRIFLPAAGRKFDTEHAEAGSAGYYWSASLNTEECRRAVTASFSGPNGNSPANLSLSDQLRYVALPIRPVYDR